MDSFCSRSGIKLLNLILFGLDIRIATHNFLLYKINHIRIYQLDINNDRFADQILFAFQEVSVFYQRDHACIFLNSETRGAFFKHPGHELISSKAQTYEVKFVPSLSLACVQNVLKMRLWMEALICLQVIFNSKLKMKTIKGLKRRKRHKSKPISKPKPSKIGGTHGTHQGGE